MLYSVIMAGGRGTRFWPLSRKKRPKQLLPIVGEQTMLQATVERIAPLCPPERILIVTGADQAEELIRQIPQLPPENIIVEPVGRNTAPCVALSAMIIKNRDPEAIMAVFPADHVITRPAELIKTIQSVVELIEKQPDQLAVIGIKPSYPETGYGYIKRGAPITGQIFMAQSFLEKPELATAREYVESGICYWNAGMFFWKAQAILEQVARHMPALSTALEPVEKSVGAENFNAAMERTYPNLPAESIDYGVMEKAGEEGKVAVAVCDPGWNDVGSWRSLYSLMTPGADGNRSRSRLIAIDSTGIVAHNEKRVVAVVGVKDLVIVETDDAILVCHKDKAQDVRQVIAELEKLGLENLL